MWIHKKADKEKVGKIERILKCHKIVASLLVNRGIDTPEQAYSFLCPSLKRLTDPFCLKDMDKAVKRIWTAIENHERILIFGDFDADGVTSTSILNDFFSSINAEVSWYVPHRTKEGYSLKKNHIDMAIDRCTDLIITVDCGSDSNEAVLAAKREDIDIIITDHHEVPEDIPPALALINPKRQDCTSGLSHLAGVGVAFYLVIALRKYLREKGFWEHKQEPNLIRYCDLVAIGTIADMVPLKKENRILSCAGINIMKKGERPGLVALSQVSGIDLKDIDSDDISFRIAPRINAAGRISHARICVDLLCTGDRISAELTSEILDRLNRKRQETEQSIIDDIEKKIIKFPEFLNKSALIMCDRSWNPGVLGIAASKMAKKYFKPVILISTGSSPAVGSCRSIESVNLYRVLNKCSSMLENFGGHFMAAGLSIKEDRIKEFSNAFEKQISEIIAKDNSQKTLYMDCSLVPGEITEDLVNEMNMLRPFGTDNPEPVFYCSDLVVCSCVLINAKHRKMVLEKSGYRVEAMQFNIKSQEMPVYFKEIAFKLKMNRFGKKKYPQIIIIEEI